MDDGSNSFFDAVRGSFSADAVFYSFKCLAELELGLTESISAFVAFLDDSYSSDTFFDSSLVGVVFLTWRAWWRKRALCAFIAVMRETAAS